MRIRAHKKADARTISVLRGMRLFAGCSDHEIERMAMWFEEGERSAGSVLMREGDRGDEFFVIVEGSATATLRGEKLASLGPGDFAGEMSLLDDSPRAATVIAETDLVLLAIDAAGFARLLHESPSVGRKLLVGLASRLRDVETEAPAAQAAQAAFAS